MELFRDSKINFVGAMKPAFIISMALVLISARYAADPRRTAA